MLIYIHDCTELKPENILVCSDSFIEKDCKLRNGKIRRLKLPAEKRIKLIDFGNATYDNEHKSDDINTRQVCTCVL